MREKEREKLQKGDNGNIRNGERKRKRKKEKERERERERVSKFF